jgi:hypothetical protein
MSALSKSLAKARASIASEKRQRAKESAVGGAAESHKTYSFSNRSCLPGAIPYLDSAAELSDDDDDDEDERDGGWGASNSSGMTDDTVSSDSSSSQAAEVSDEDDEIQRTTDEQRARGVVREALSEQADEAPPEITPHDAAQRLAQFTAILNNRQTVLSPAMRKAYEARIVSLQRIVDREPVDPENDPSGVIAAVAPIRAPILGGAPAPPPPAGAAHGGGGAGAPGCPICRESFRILQAESAAHAAEEEAEAGATAAPKKKRKRQTAAVAQVGTDGADVYKTVFEFEEVMRGVMPDDQICTEMLWLYREFVYKPLTKIGIQCDVWTYGQLLQHFDVNNGHIVDPVRTLIMSIRDTIQLKKKVHAFCERPDAARPGQKFIDYKAVTCYEKLAKLNILEFAKFAAHFDNRRDNNSAVVRSLVSVLSKAHVREAVTTDSRVAAGAIMQGGDAARTVGVKAKASSRDINNF